MQMKTFFLVGAAALALTACGKKEEGGTTPAAEGAAKATTASPLEQSFRLSDAEPLDVDALFSMMPEKSRPSYESANFDEKLGATVVTNLRFSDGPADGESVLVERAEFYGLDLDAIERVKAAESVGADAPMEALFKKVRLLNISGEGFDEEDGQFSVGGIEFDRLAVRQGGPKGDGEGNEAARLFNAIELGGLYFKDISFSANEETAAAVAMSAPDLRFVGLGGGKLGAIIANDLEYEITQSEASLAAIAEAMGPQAGMVFSGPLRSFIAPENQRVTIDSFEWRGIDLSGLMAWGLKGETPPATARDLIDLGTIKAAGMESFIEDRRAMAAKEATVSAMEFTWLIPSKFRADSKGAVTDFTAYLPETETEALEILKKHGLDKVAGDGHAEWNWNADSGVADLDYSAAMSGLADVSMALGLNGLKLEDLAAEDADENIVAQLAALRGFSLTFKDETALDVMFEIAALQMGGSAEDLRQSAPAMIRLSGAQAAQMNPRIADYVDAFANFVAKGGTLEIAASPAEPVTMQALETVGSTSPQTIPDVLNLNVTHKE